jgi:hypothetical protein
MTTDPLPSRYIDPRGSTRPGTILTPSTAARDPFARLLGYLRKLGRERFYGDVRISFRDGEINVLHVEQTIKPGDLALADTTIPTISAKNTGDIDDNPQHS